MTDYGKGSVLSAASVLPATGAMAYVLSERVNPAIIYGLIAVSVVSLVYLVGSVSRYLANRKN